VSTAAKPKLSHRLSKLWTLYRLELTAASRERNVLLYVLFIPLLLYPLMVWFTMTTLSFLIGMSERQVCSVTLVGLPAQMSDLPAQLTHQFPDWKVSKAEEMAGRSSRNDQSAKPQTPDQVAEIPDLRLTFGPEPTSPIVAEFDSSSKRSLGCKEKFGTFFRSYQDYWLEQQTLKAGHSLEKIQTFSVAYRNRAKPQDVGKFLLGILLPFTLVIILSLGGMYSAIDCTAGERERGSWETTLTLAVPHSDIILAKYAYVTTMSFVAGLLNLISMTLSLRSFIAPLSLDYANQMTMSFPLRSLPVVVLGTFLLSALLSALMLLLGGLARTFREGQSLVSPLFLSMLLPTTMVLDTNLELNYETAMIPVVNIALLWRESLQSKTEADLAVIATTVTAFCVILCLYLAQKLMSRETLLLEGGFPTPKSIWLSIRKATARKSGSRG
jgi:sodium transport system permease protein